MTEGLMAAALLLLCLCALLLCVVAGVGGDLSLAAAAPG